MGTEPQRSGKAFVQSSTIEFVCCREPHTTTRVIVCSDSSSESWGCCGGGVELGCSAGKQQEAAGNGCTLCIHRCLSHPTELSLHALQHPNLKGMSLLLGRQCFHKVPFVFLNMG